MGDRETADYFGQGNKYITELTPSDFESVAPWRLKGGASGMVLFYAPWCGYCKRVAPEWEKAAKTVGFCEFYAFNCEKYKDHVMKIKEDTPELIKGYPSIVIYKEGSPDEYYDGDRSSKSLVSTCMRTCSKNSKGFCERRS